jgi:hypothetical protein
MTVERVRYAIGRSCHEHEHMSCWELRPQYLYAAFEDAQQLHLVFREQLCEGNQTAHLNGHLSMVFYPIAKCQVSPNFATSTSCGPPTESDHSSSR